MIQCPSCGGALRFDIPSQHLVCESCGGHYDPASTAAVDKEAKGVKTYETYVFTCPSCGGELQTSDPTDAVGFCPFCGGASMLFERVHQQWEPQYIIPFRITKERCKEIYIEEAKKALFTSNAYRDPKLIESFRGIYVPYWQYKAVHKGTYELDASRDVGSTTSYYKVSGEINYAVDGYAHDASVAFDDRAGESIMPYHTEDQVPFAPGYLSGFYADIADVDAHTYDEAGKASINKSTLCKLGQELGMSVTEQNAKLPTEVIGAQRMLYPVWFMGYRNKNKVTYAAINGQTGKMYAEFPLSPARVLLASLVCGAALTLLLMLLLPAVKAAVTLGFTALMLFVGSLMLLLNAKKVRNASERMAKTKMVRRFMGRSILYFVIGAVSALIGLIIAMSDPAMNIVSYSTALILIAELVYFSCRHMAFQKKIAGHRPPQFNKRGAAYDEK